MKLSPNGRCCGKKPIVYKTAHYAPGGPQLYCDRCYRSYNLESREQISNWAWEKRGDEFVATPLARGRYVVEEE